MAFKMKNPSVAKMVKMAGNNRTAMKMKAEEAAAMKMKKAAMKLKEEAAMKLKKEAAMKLKKESAMKLDQKKANKPSPTEKPQPAILRKDKATSEKVGKAMAKGAVAGAKSSAKRTSPMKAAKPDFPDIDGDGNTSESMKKAAADKKSGMKMKKSPAKMGHSPKKMKKSAMKLSEADKKKAMENAMPAAKVQSMSKESMAAAKKYGFMNEGGSFNKDKAKTELRRLSNMTGQTDSNRAKQAEIRKLMKAFS
tara:strand:- start:44 stop:796 length:753 start_codon:yes stop_codon:yes gene_type:complete